MTHRRALRTQTEESPTSRTRTLRSRSCRGIRSIALCGSRQEIQQKVRAHEGGRLRLDDGRLPADQDPALSGIDQTGFNQNYWAGLSPLHTLFSLEHNAICDRLRQDYPHFSDEQLFQKARLINAALIAKIHTIEWTPAILGHPALEISMNGN